MDLIEIDNLTYGIKKLSRLIPDLLTLYMKDKNILGVYNNVGVVNMFFAKFHQ